MMMTVVVSADGPGGDSVELLLQEGNPLVGLFPLELQESDLVVQSFVLLAEASDLPLHGHGRVPALW